MNQFNKFIVISTVACAACTSFGALANTVSNITPSAQTAEPNKPFSLTFTFAGNQANVGCGLVIDWGDGKIEKFRVGEGQQLLPPYTVEHTYTAPGDYKVKISGELIARGLRTVGPCDVKREGTVAVIDPIEAAKQAEAKAAAERERRERQEAEIKMRREKAEAEAVARKERAEAQRAEEVARAAKEAAEKSKREAEIMANLSTIIAKASIKSCDEFIAAFKSRFQYAYAYPDITCTRDFDNDGIFLIKDMRSGTRFWFQPKTETILSITNQGHRDLLRAKNFIRTTEPDDMNASGEIPFLNLPVNQRLEVCKRIKTVSRDVVYEHSFRLAAGYQAAELAKEGNWNWSLRQQSGGCDLFFNISGIYEGTSYNKSVRCPIGKIEKRPDSSYMVLDVIVGLQRCSG